MSRGIVFSRRILKNDQQTYVPDPEVASRLLEWYGREGRDLPWRRTRDPYRIWISEVILQQTRVAQGMSYYHRFLELFPDVAALASAPEDLVLKCWQGLGYYSRARNLLAAALHSLPDEKRQAVLLYYFFDMTDVEIAELMKVLRSTVQYRRTSSFELLKRYLEERADEWDEL